MKPRIVVLTLLALASLPLACRSKKEAPKTSTTTLTSADLTNIPVPAGATLTGSTAVTEIGAFPEEMGRAKGHQQLIETAAGFAATDRTYDTRLSYADAVAFYDRALSSNGYTSSHRAATGMTTLWSARSPDGRLVRVAVRDSQPTGIEIVSANAAVVNSTDKTGAVP